ncbi:MAG TPA: cobalamin biosynthesis protein [Dehalococcoidia bacterium]|nr:cobalamin biosynthesis protein [Dehalococcoidia bacterium]
MGKVIVATGRGGTGKSTFCAILSRYLAPPLLLIDVDPDQSLSDMLGINLEGEGIATVSELVGDSREARRLGTQLYFDELEASLYRNCVYRGEGFHLLTLGTKWTEGCYCREDNSLKGIIPRLIAEYRSVVIDSPSGLEHLNRRVVSHVDILFVLSDPSLKSVKHVERMKRIMEEVGISCQCLFVVENYEFDEAAGSHLDTWGEGYLGKIDYDANVRGYNLDGRSLWELPEDSAACLSVKKLLARIQEFDKCRLEVRQELSGEIRHDT